MINIYVENSNDIFPPYVESGLVNILQSKPKEYILVENKSCACETRDGISIKEWSIIINSIDNYVKNYENYVINYKSEDEIKSIIFWLVKSHFYTFDYTLIKEESITKFERHISERFFYVYHKMCGCIEYELKGEPIYCLKHIVISSREKGPTIKSVI